MTSSSSKIVLVPLDERPVNTRYPEMLAAIAGADLRLPPADMRGLQRVPADLDRVIPWLKQESLDASACIVSCDYLGYGNLINARISDDSATEVIGRLAALVEIGSRVPVHAFSLITRVSNADDCVEEPLYWAEWGTRFYLWARLRHRSETETLSATEAADLARLQYEIPQDLMADWLIRRLRNHTVNLALLEMAAREQIESLLVTSDDTAQYGFPTRERDWLRAWPALAGKPLSERVRMYPGADEVGSALVARLINENLARTPKIWIDYAIAGDEEIIAPYEDRPVRETVLGQIEACGCRVATSPGEADFVLGVVTPSPRRTDFRPEFVDGDIEERSPDYRAFLNRLAGTAKPIALADVAYPNGSDPLFSELLLAPHSPIKPGELAAYGAWNTAGNTLGVVVAQAALATLPTADAFEQKRFLAHRFLEDYGYQLRVRREARADAESHWNRREPDPLSPDEQRYTCAFIESRLAGVLAELQTRGIGLGLAIVPASVRLPWRRTFEVDFELAYPPVRLPHDP